MPQSEMNPDDNAHGSSASPLYHVESEEHNTYKHSTSILLLTVMHHWSPPAASCDMPAQHPGTHSDPQADTWTHSHMN